MNSFRSLADLSGSLLSGDNFPAYLSYSSYCF